MQGPFQTLKINDIKVKKMNIPKIDPSKIKGYDMISELYANIYMVAHKKSGKTTCIFNILKECANKDTKLVFFGSTIYNDPTYKAIFKYFKKNGNPILRYTSIMDTNDKIDRLQELLDSLKVRIEDYDSDSDNEAKKPPPPPKYISVDEDKEIEKEIKKRKPKKIAPEIIFVFDDLSKSMRIPSFVTLLKTNRHFKSKTIISSQNVKDILPDARENVDILMLFKGIKRDLLETIYEDFNIKLSLDDFIQLYNDSTQENHSFLYINTREHEFRKTFCERYLLE